MGRGNHPSSGGCLEQNCANHLIFRFAGSSVKLKKKKFSPNRSDFFVDVIFGEQKKWGKKHVDLNITSHFIAKDFFFNFLFNENEKNLECLQRNNTNRHLILKNA